MVVRVNDKLSYLAAYCTYLFVTSLSFLSFIDLRMQFAEYGYTLVRDIASPLREKPLTHQFVM